MHQILFEHLCKIKFFKYKMLWVFWTVRLSNFTMSCHAQVEECQMDFCTTGYQHHASNVSKLHRPSALLYWTWRAVYNILFKVIFKYLKDVASIRTSDSIWSRLGITSFLFSWHPHAACELLRVNICIVTWKLIVVNVNCTRLRNCPILK